MQLPSQPTSRRTAFKPNASHPLPLGFLVLCLLMISFTFFSCNNSENAEDKKQPMVESPPDVPPCPPDTGPSSQEVSLPALPPEEAGTTPNESLPQGDPSAVAPPEEPVEEETEETPDPNEEPSDEATSDSSGTTTTPNPITSPSEP